MSEKRANNHEVKKINRNQIYRYVCKYGKVSNPDIAKALGISMPTIHQNIRELMEWGLIHEDGVFESTGGRKARVIAPVYNFRYAIGIDITKNHVGFALTDLSGNVLIHRRQYMPFANERQYYAGLGEMAEEFLCSSDIPKDRFLGFGISVPGIVDARNDVITFSHVLGITNVPCSIFSQFIPYPCIFTNDANAALIAEMFRFSERKPTVLLSLSNSVGGAIFYESSNGLEEKQVGDSLYYGDNFRSGEFGHMTLFPGGKKCYCGKIGCTDAYLSAKILSEHTDGKLEIFFEEMEKGNKEFAQIWEEYLSNLAIAVNNLRMFSDCQVIIGGYVGSFIEPYLSYLQEKAAALNTFENNALYIKPCHYKVEASALGAALRLVEGFLYTI